MCLPVVKTNSGFTIDLSSPDSQESGTAIDGVLDGYVGLSAPL